MELLTEGVTGGIGGLVGRSVAFPFDTLKVKRATNSEGTLAALVRTILSEEGIPGFYRGLPWSALEALYQKSLYVLLYAALKMRYQRLFGRPPAVLGSLACGYFSDLVCVPFSMPLEAMVVQLQSAPADVSRADIVRKALFTKQGILTSLKSGRAYFVLSVKPGIEFAIFDRVKRGLLKRLALGPAADLASGTAFLLGAFARAVATCVVYPYARGKALSQAQLAPTALEALREVLRREGPGGLYRGLFMELSRGVTQAAVMFMVMERVRAVVRRSLGL